MRRRNTPHRRPQGVPLRMAFAHRVDPESFAPPQPKNMAGVVPVRRAKTSARGYGARHQALRQQWARVVAEGAASCARCGGWIVPGSRWHLDHADGDRGQYIGVSHARCNTVAANIRRGRARHRRSPGGAAPSQTIPARVLVEPARDW